MTWDQIKTWIIKYRIFVSVCAALLTLLVWDIATTENKLYIETAQSEDNFVVVCTWYGNTEMLHGGVSRVKTRVLIGNSNASLDCGWWLYGDLTVLVMHPLYRKISGCDHPMLCETPGFRYIDDKMIFTPISIDQYFSKLQKIYEGEELYDKFSSFIGDHFYHRYFKSYAQVREPDIEQFKELYSERLLTVLQRVSTFDYAGKKRGSPELSVEAYWKSWKEYNERN